MSEMIILVGLPASGKSTYAREWLVDQPADRIRINYDDLRIEMFGPGWKWNRADETKMQTHAKTLALVALGFGKSVIIDNTNLSKRVQQGWVDLAAQHQVESTILDLGTPIEDCIANDANREARVGRAVIERMALFHDMFDWQDLLGDSKIVICDVDGTLANTDHRQHYVQNKPKNWLGFFNECHLDPVIEPIKHLLEDFANHGYYIIIVSGRPTDLCGIKTEDWLDENEIPYDHLFMRQGSDGRPDTIVKKEILDRLPKEKVAFVIDDRPSVLRMWRENGLTTLAVGDLKEF